MLEKTDETFAGILEKLGTHENAEQFLELAATGYFYQSIVGFCLGIFLVLATILLWLISAISFRKNCLAEAPYVFFGLGVFLGVFSGIILAINIQGVFAPETMAITDLIRRM